MKVRTYGSFETSGHEVVVLHGGPGTVGYMAPVARGLAGQFSVTEPLQRASTPGERMTVAHHVSDLDHLLRTHPGTPSCSSPALIGSSWGAMLALVWAASHPDLVGPIVLIGCGTFDRSARALMQATLEARMNPALRQHLRQLPVEYSDSDARLKARAELLLPLYSYELIRPDADLELESVDSRAHLETWQDMIRLQEEDIYPQAFAAIKTPILMLHGAADPHPGRMILESLRPYLPQIEYHKWERCGHYPWLEKHVHEEFFSLLSSWLTTHL